MHPNVWKNARSNWYYAKMQGWHYFIHLQQLLLTINCFASVRSAVAFLTGRGFESFSSGIATAMLLSSSWSHQALWGAYLIDFLKILYLDAAYRHISDANVITISYLSCQDQILFYLSFDGLSSLLIIDISWFFC